MEFILRPFEGSDLPGVTQLLEVSEQVDGPTWPVAAHLFARRLLTLADDPRKDARLAVSSSGQVVGYALLSPQTGAGRPGGVELRCWGTVHPKFRRQGVGRALLDWAIECWGNPGGDFMSAAAKRDNRGAHVLFERCGFDHTAYSWQMRRAPSRIPPPSVPDGIQMRPFQRNRDAARLRDAFQEAFSAPESALTLTRGQTWREIDLAQPLPGATMLAEEGDRLVGFYHTRRCPWSDNEGEVYFWGVIPDWRRQGLGRSLLALAVSDLARAGYPSVVAEVSGREMSDIEHYHILGFHEFDRVDWYTRSPTNQETGDAAL